MAFLGFAALRFEDLTLPLRPALALWFLAGILYTNLFEYWVHRFPMHRGLPLLRHVRSNHIEHHRVFHGKNFRTANPSDLAHISGRFWIFPVLLAIHYVLLTAFVPIDASLAFLSACFLHYLAFEISHWLSHLEGNAVDRVLSRIPVLASIRAYQIEHHRIHHQTPIAAFNFNPPYLGDALVRPPTRSFGEPGRSPEGEGRWTTARPVTDAVPVLARPRLPARPAILYGTALVLGVVAIGIAAIGHTRPASGAPVPRAKS
jgi:hypothetical protein